MTKTIITAQKVQSSLAIPESVQKLTEDPEAESAHPSFPAKRISENIRLLTSALTQWLVEDDQIGAIKSKVNNALQQLNDNIVWRLKEQSGIKLEVMDKRAPKIRKQAKELTEDILKATKEAVLKITDERQEVDSKKLREELDEISVSIESRER